ncbi:MAG: T9SS C-terminal target domain-containing protein [Bacteroidetes bacterium]|nr:MAG: T9SS C-terminal target domain-containing protein [Bacteroidota bacterium]
MKNTLRFLLNLSLRNLFSKTVLLALVLTMSIFGKTNAQPTNPFPVPEYDPSEYVIIRYPFNTTIWPLYSQLIWESQEAATTILLVNNNNELQILRGLLDNDGIPETNIQILMIPANRMWVRDHGPLAIQTDNGPAFMNFIDYNNSGPNDQNLPVSLANHWGYEHYSIDWILDGGNYLVDSYGNMFTTTRLYNNNPSIAPEVIDQTLQDYMGVTNIVTVSPQYDDYWGHIDMQMKLLNDTTFVISSVQSGSGPNYNVLEANVAIIEGLTAPNGNPYHIARLPKADNWKTYANSLILNNKVIVPIYNHPNDQIALDTYSALMPNHTVVGINSNSIIGWGGAIHCITMQVFAEPKELFELAINISGSGKVQVNGEDYEEPMEVEDESTLLLDAIPDSGFDFSGWSGDLSGHENPTEVIMSDHLSINAHFRRVSGDYATVRPGRTSAYKHYDHYGYQKTLFLRITEENQTSEGTEYYLAPHINKIHYDCYTPDYSFLGQKASFMNNRDDVFLNYNNDSIIIRTIAQENETWVLFENDELIITGEVISHQPENILGQTDSVKTINLQAYNVQMDSIDHNINGLHLKLSKNYGLIRTLNFLSFPDETSGMVKNLSTYELTGITNPNLGVQNLTWMDVHDFEPGDEIHVVSLEHDSFIESYKYIKTKIIFRYLLKENMQDSVLYTIERIIEKEQRWDPGENLTITHTNDTITSLIKPWDDFDNMAGYPIIQGETITTHNQATLENGRIIKYPDYETFFYFSAFDCWEYSHIDGCWPLSTYYKGLAGPYYHCDEEFGESYRELVYYKKGDETWGAPLIITSADEPARELQVSLYPNPAGNSFHISVHPEKLPVVFEMVDVSGRVVMRKNIENTAESADVSTLSRGFYLYRITDKSGKIHTGRIILQ